MSDTRTQFYSLGYDPIRAMAAKEEYRASDVYTQVIYTGDTPPTASLPRLRSMEQGQAGTCWAHSGTAVAECRAQTKGQKVFPICRRLVGWYGKQLEGGGNPSNGGAPVDALYSMTRTKGKGVAHEALCPYTDQASVLGQKPPQEVFEDAKKVDIAALVDVKDLDDVITLVGTGFPVAIGIWWPFGWDNREAIHRNIGPGTFGHALMIFGYAKKGVFDDKQDYFRIDNWHGVNLYPVLEDSLANKVANYSKTVSSDHTSDFWVSRELLQSVINRGNSSLDSITDLEGIEGGITSEPSFEWAFSQEGGGWV